MTASPDVSTGVPLPDYTYCPDCDYDLRTLTSRRCPECGLDLAFVESNKSLIPWENRQELGRIRTYLSTVLMVTTRTPDFRRAMCQRVDRKAADRFRLVSMFIAYATFVATLGLVQLLLPTTLPELAQHCTVWSVIALFVLPLPMLTIVTGMPSYFFRPRHLTRDQQERAVSLCFYGSAPLAFLPLVFACICLIAWQYGSTDDYAPAWGTGILAAAFNLFLVWNTQAYLARLMLRRTLTRFLVSIVSPVLETIAIVVLVAATVGTGFFLIIVYYSLVGP